MGTGRVSRVEVNGRFIYNKVLKLVDYCGDIEKKNNYTGSDYREYSSDFSPNNIKKLVVSPDGSLLFYHLKTKGGKVSRANWSIEMYKKVSVLPDYIPMISVLVEDRVCASIEEIILVSKSVDGSFNLSNAELSYENLIKGYRQGVSGNLKEQISERYKRLYSITIFYGSMEDLLSGLTTYKDDGLSMISDLPLMSSASRTFFHKDDWYKGYGSSANFYSYDSKGGSLSNHFASIILKYEKMDKDRKVRASALASSKKIDNTKVSKELESRYTRELYRFSGIYTCVNRLRVIGANGINVLYRSCDLCVKDVVLQDAGGYVSSGRGVDVEDRYSDSDSEALESNIVILKEASLDAFIQLTENVLSSVHYLLSSYPIVSSQIMLDECTSCHIFEKSTDLVRINDDIEMVTGSRFKDCSWDDSVSNCCTMLCRYFMSNIGERSIAKYQTKYYWLSLINYRSEG